MIHRLTKLWGCKVSNTSYPIGTLWGLVISRCSWKISHAVVQAGDLFKDKAILVSRDKLVSSVTSKDTLILPIGSGQSTNGNEGIQSICSDPSVTKLDVSLDPPRGWALTRPTPIPAFPMPMVSSFYVISDEAPSDTANPLADLPQSGRDLIGCEVQGVNGRAGSVYDLLIDDDSWTVRFVVLDTGRWFSGRKVLLLASWLGQNGGIDSTLTIDLSADEVKNGLEYDSTRILNHGEESYTR